MRKNEPDELPLNVRVERLARRLGTVAAAKALGISRESILGVIAEMNVRAGTLALIRERIDAAERVNHKREQPQ
jgi:hypothetical protein